MLGFCCLQTSSQRSKSVRSHCNPVRHVLYCNVNASLDAVRVVFAQRHNDHNEVA